MFCIYCGADNPDDAQFCSNCGKKSLIEVENDNIVDKNIVKLKNFKETKECTCLECGYSGMMGVVRYKMSSGKKNIIELFIWVGIWIIIGFYIPSFIIRFIITFVINALIVLALRLNKKILFCPNCGKEVVER